MSVKTKLEEEFESQIKELHKIDVGSEKYKVAVDGVTKIADRIIECEKIDKELDFKNSELAVNSELKSEENRISSNRNMMDIFKTGAPIVAAFTMGLISMKWEKVDVLSSTAGKSVLREVLRFK